MYKKSNISLSQRIAHCHAINHISAYLKRKDHPLNTNVSQLLLDTKTLLRTLLHSLKGVYYEDRGAHASQCFTPARGNPRAAHHLPLHRAGGESPGSSVKGDEVIADGSDPSARRGNTTFLPARDQRGQEGY